MLYVALVVTAFVTIYTSGFGITAGVHRLWSHKAYKAKWPLRLLLVFLFTITGQVRKFYNIRNKKHAHVKFSDLKKGNLFLLQTRKTVYIDFVRNER